MYSELFFFSCLLLMIPPAASDMLSLMKDIILAVGRLQILEEKKPLAHASIQSGR